MTLEPLCASAAPNNVPVAAAPDNLPVTIATANVPAAADTDDVPAGPTAAFLALLPVSPVPACARPCLSAVCALHYS